MVAPQPYTNGHFIVIEEYLGVIVDFDLKMVKTKIYTVYDKQNEKVKHCVLQISIFK